MPPWSGSPESTASDCGLPRRRGGRIKGGKKYQDSPQPHSCHPTGDEEGKRRVLLKIFCPHLLCNSWFGLAHVGARDLGSGKRQAIPCHLGCSSGLISLPNTPVIICMSESQDACFMHPVQGFYCNLGEREDRGCLSYLSGTEMTNSVPPLFFFYLRSHFPFAGD